MVRHSARKPTATRIILFLVVAVVLYITRDDLVETPDSQSSIEQAYAQRQSDLQVHGEGRVKTVLPDDLDGSRHQRFILQLDSGHTLLIAHNIDLAPKINGLSVGDRVSFFGEYEWNQQGGVVHWTHRDPGGRHEHGWLKHKGQSYQ